MRRLILAGCASVVAGCAQTAVLTSTLEASPAAPRPYVGAGVVALAPAQAETEMRRAQELLSARLAGVPAASAGRADGMELRVKLDAERTFDGGSAQIDAAALEGYAAIAGVLRDLDGMVVHVLVRAPAAEGEEPHARLSARRAASLVSYFERRSVPASRLRAEGRDAAPGAAEVVLVLRAVVQGREAEAWMTPAGE